MSTKPDGLRAAQQAIWARAKPEVDRRVATIARAVVGLLEDTLADPDRTAAQREAHKLAGAAGSFGFPSASSVALELEDLLAEPGLDAADGPRAARLLELLRQYLAADVSAGAPPERGENDVLTGLPLRSGLRQAWSRRRSTLAADAASLAVIDVDDLEYLTDVLGDQAGNRVVQDVAAALSAGTTDRDCVARLAAGRFGVLVHRAPAEQLTALDAALRDLRRRRGVTLTAGTVVRVSVSGGIVAAGPGHDFEDACRGAESLVVRAQALGGDRIVVGSVPDARDR